MTGSILVRNGDVLTPDGWRRGDVSIESGRIVTVGRAERPANVRVVDAKGARVLPGLVDLQVNGAFTKSFASATVGEIGEVARGLARFGVTGFLASMVSLPTPLMLEALSRIREASDGESGDSILGAHLEGPYLNPERAGAHRRANIRPPSLVEFGRLASGGSGIVRMMTIAPEGKGAVSLIAAGLKRGIGMSIGHTLASRAEVDAAIRAGASMATHLFNAMAPLHHREENAPAAALVDDRLTCACIYDRFHIGRSAMTIAHRCKPRGRLMLVSDATSALGAPDGAFESDGVKYSVKAGQVKVRGTETLGGSAVSLLQGVRNVVEDLGLPLEEAWRMASAVPARAIGLGATKGEIAAGFDGDIVLLDEHWQVRATFVRGREVHGDHH